MPQTAIVLHLLLSLFLCIYYNNYAWCWSMCRAAVVTWWARLVRLTWAACRKESAVPVVAISAWNNACVQPLPRSQFPAVFQAAYKSLCVERLALLQIDLHQMCLASSIAPPWRLHTVVGPVWWRVSVQDLAHWSLSKSTKLSLHPWHDGSLPLSGLGHGRGVARQWVWLWY